MPQDEVLQEQLWKLRTKVVVLRAGGNLLRTGSVVLRTVAVMHRSVVWRYGAAGSRGHTRPGTQSLIFLRRFEIENRILAAFSAGGDPVSFFPYGTGTRESSDAGPTSRMNSHEFSDTQFSQAQIIGLTDSVGLRI